MTDRPRALSPMLGAALCLVLAVVGELAGLPVAVRAPLTVVGLLLAPGLAWVSALPEATSRVPEPARWLLMVSVSLGLLALAGVIINTVGLAVTGENVAVAVLVVTVPAIVLRLRGVRAPRPSRLSLPGSSLILTWAATGTACLSFIGAVAWGATWMHLVSTGPYVRLSYAGTASTPSGPISVSPRAPLSLPVAITTSGNQAWTGEVAVLIDRRLARRQAVSLTGERTVSLAVSAPRGPGRYLVDVVASSSTGAAPLRLTLHLDVSGGHG